jgi:fatty-acyl-CoA synthase
MDLAPVIQRHAQIAPAKLALHHEGRDITYADFWQRIEGASAVLQAAGVRAGDRVAWLGLNHPDLLVLLFALARIGAILLPLNYRLAAPEHANILSHAGVSLMVVDPMHEAVATALVKQAGCSFLQSSRLAGHASAGGTAALEGGADSPVLLVYTSGTSGQPKGVLHTQSGLVWNCVISAHAHDLTADDHVLSALPMFHVGGLCIQTLPALYAGASVTLHSRFDAGGWLADVAARRPELSLLVPATLRAVIEHCAFAGTDLSSLRILATGSSTIPSSMIEAFHRRGVPVSQVYGATETGPVSIYLRREEAMQRAGSAGRAGLHIEIRLADEQGRPVAPGQVGEVWVQGPNLLCTYWRDPGNPSFVDGWFHTGDLARCDDEGFYEIVGRSKDMIISGGENIYPAEIENLLVDSPLVAEAAVVGEPDPRWGEVVVAVVVRAPGATLDADGVMRLFDGKLARFKHPKRIVFCDGLPKTALGKVQKTGLLALVSTPAGAA